MLAQLRKSVTCLLLIVTTYLISGCANTIGKETKLHGDEIVVAGRFFRTGTRVVTWLEHEGYDANRTDARFEPFAQSSWEHLQARLSTPNRYNIRTEGFRASIPPLSDQQIEMIRHGG